MDGWGVGADDSEGAKPTGKTAPRFHIYVVHVVNNMCITYAIKKGPTKSKE